MTTRNAHRPRATIASGEPVASASEMLQALSSGELSALDLLEEHLARIDAQEATIRAWAYIDADGARARARAMARERSDAPLYGIPIGLKDNIDTCDMPTGYGSAIHAGHRPGRDAACVAALRLAGANPLGKTVTAEFAHRTPGPTANPWHPQHTPGGSSSGSAAAVASAMVPLALGSQTTGSVIRPAAYCGVIGYKPTYGEFNIAGTLANTPSFDTLGVMARCVADVVLVRRALLDASVPALRAMPLHSRRVGVCRTPNWHQADGATQRLVQASAEHLARAGANVCDFDDGGALADLEQANQIVSGYEFARTLAHERRTDYEQLSPALRDGRMADGLRARYSDYVRAREQIERSRDLLHRALVSVDFVLTPSAPGPAPLGLEATGSAVFNQPWTTLHVPAVTLPVARSDEGLPLGVQLVARRHCDDQLLSDAEAVFALLHDKD